MSAAVTTTSVCPTCGAVPDDAAWEPLARDIERTTVTCCPVAQMVLRRQVDGEWRYVWRPVLGGRVRQAFACTRQDMQRGGWRP